MVPSSSIFSTPTVSISSGLQKGAFPYLEMPGIEPMMFCMQSGCFTTKLQPGWQKWMKFTDIVILSDVRNPYTFMKNLPTRVAFTILV